MNDTRRQFLVHSSAALAGTTAMSSLSSAARDDKSTPTLLTIYLRGGADPLGMLIPYKDPAYTAVRPTIALSGPDSKDRHAALPLDDTFALNPAMASLLPLFKQGLCAPIVCVGSHHPTRSHFDAQDFMERGAPGLRHVSDGWLNRYLLETNTRQSSPLRALAMQPRLPRSLRGNYPVLAVPDQSVVGSTVNVFENMYRLNDGKPTPSMRQRVRRDGERTVNQLHELAKLMQSSESDDSGGARYPTTPFGSQMRRIARLIKAGRGLEVAAVDYGGWDHHIDEGPINGNMAKHLRYLSDGVAAFVKDIGPRIDHTTILVMSEFGRTVKENGNFGTDHGHGGVMLAIGGKVKGGQVYGRWTGLDPKHLYEQRDLPVHTDFRVVFAETLHRQFGFDAIREGLFPQYTSDSPPPGFMS